MLDDVQTYVDVIVGLVHDDDAMCVLCASGNSEVGGVGDISKTGILFKSKIDCGRMSNMQLRCWDPNCRQARI